MKKIILNLLIVSLSFGNIISAHATAPYQIVGTGQTKFYSSNNEISRPKSGSDYYGQDASYITHVPSYTDNKNGTITDNVTGLIWQKSMNKKMTFDEAVQYAKKNNLTGANDWRVPSVKELYSLIQFSGRVKGQRAIELFIDTTFFDQPIGDSSKGERQIDAQTWSSTEYVGKTMRNDDTVFGVNFVDGRIKGYPKYNPRTRKPNKMYFRLVRGNRSYGKNNFALKNSEVIADNATGLMWQRSDSLKGMNWKNALKYAENLKLGGYDDWRLPNAKELQSILDYSRSPETTNSAAIDPIFITSSILNEAGQKDYSYYWTSTTHLDGKNPESNAAYLSFGRAMGKMRGRIMDVHGAGSQRSDPKMGQPMSRGPQGDMIRVNNFVRCVRGGNAKFSTSDSVMSKNQNTGIELNSMQKRFMKRHDKNSDGKISRDEFAGPSRRFPHFDKNGDGYITEDESPTTRPKK